MSPLLVCNLDESGTNKQSPIVTIGGYIAIASAWSGFEVTARSIFNAYGVSYLHGVEFQNRKPPFNTWSPIKQRTFVIELFDVVRRTVEFGVTFSVRKDAYLQAKQVHGRNRNESAYGFAFRGALEHMMRSSDWQSPGTRRACHSLSRVAVPTRMTFGAYSRYTRPIRRSRPSWAGWTSPIRRALLRCKSQISSLTSRDATSPHVNSVAASTLRCPTFSRS